MFYPNLLGLDNVNRSSDASFYSRGGFHHNIGSFRNVAAISSEGG